MRHSNLIKDYIMQLLHIRPDKKHEKALSKIGSMKEILDELTNEEFNNFTDGRTIEEIREKIEEIICDK